MDFVISSQRILTADIEKCYEFCSDANITQHSLNLCENYSFLGFSNTVFNAQGKYSAFWDGQYSWKGEYRHPMLTDSYPLLSEIEMLAGQHKVPNGIFCAVYADLKSGTFKISRDNLSQYPLYYVEKNGGYYISNNSRMLAIVSGCEDRTGMGSIENCIYGGVYDSTHYKDIKLLEFNRRFEGGKKLIFKSQENEYFEGLSYLEVIKKAYESISEHIAAVSKIKDVKYLTSDLTGGTDSRVLLALLLGSYDKKSIGYRCMGQYPNADANVAAYLIEKLGLSRALYPDVNVPLEQKIRNSAALGGGTIQADVAYRSNKIDKSIHFQGTYGELSGSFGFDPYKYYINKGEKYTFLKHAKLISDRRYNAKIIDIVSMDAKKSAEKSYTEHLEDMSEEGIDLRDLSMELKLRDRSRSHFGMQSFIGNRSKVLPSPFANRWFLAARYLLDNESLSIKKALYDLASLSENRDVLWNPMAGRKWDERLIDSKDLDKYNDIEIITRDSKNLSGTSGSLFEMLNIKSASYRPLVKLRGVTEVKGSIHNSKLKTYLSMASLFLNEYGSQHDIWNYWDRSKVFKVVNRESIEFRTDGLDIEVLGLFVSSSTWLVGLDKWQSIS